MAERRRKEREKETGKSQGEGLIDTVIGGTARANARARRARPCAHVDRVARLIAGFQFNNAIMRCLSSSHLISLSPTSIHTA